MSQIQIQTSASQITHHNQTKELTSKQKMKCPPPTLKCKQSKTPSDQVITQIKLPPYHGPRSPLYLVVVEIIFGGLFKAFRHVSQATGVGTSVGGAAQPAKKTRGLPLKSILTPR
jgi:hypothetical protein